jgi:hypothetical protein
LTANNLWIINVVMQTLFHHHLAFEFPLALLLLLQDAMKFNGPAPELINGRLAMVGLLAGMKFNGPAPELINGRLAMVGLLAGMNHNLVHQGTSTYTCGRYESQPGSSGYINLYLHFMCLFKS